MQAAEELYSTLEPCRLEEDVTFIDGLGGAMGELLLDHENASEKRRALLAERGRQGIDRRGRC